MSLSWSSNYLLISEFRLNIFFSIVLNFSDDRHSVPIYKFQKLVFFRFLKKMESSHLKCRLFYFHLKRCLKIVGKKSSRCLKIVSNTVKRFLMARKKEEKKKIWHQIKENVNMTKTCKTNNFCGFIINRSIWCRMKKKDDEVSPYPQCALLWNSFNWHCIEKAIEINEKCG